jgi:PRTRC genetic system protein C
MVEKIKRIFKYNGKELEDPDPDLTPKNIAKYFSMQYPELTSGSIKYLGLVTNEKGGEYMNYELSASIGIKG